MSVYEIKTKRIYRPVFTTRARYIDIWGGRARGGSHFATDYFLWRITQPHYFRGVFLRAVFSDIKDSLFRDFKDRVDNAVSLGFVKYEDFAFNHNEYTITYIPTGWTIISKGFKKSSGNQSAKLKSVAGCTHAIIEECEEVAWEDFAQFDDSLRTDKVENIQVIRLFNPPSKNHWLIKSNYILQPSFFKGWYNAQPIGNPDLLSIHSTYRDNLKHTNESTKKNYEEYGDATSPRYKPDYYHRNVLGLISEGQKGRIFGNVKPIKYSLFKELPYPSFYGLDFGFNDPVAVPELKYHNGKLFCHQRIYEPGLDNDELAAKMIECGLLKKRGYADSAEPKSIKTLQKKGFNLTGADKGADSIAYGIRELQNIEIYITEESRDFWLEAEEYHWALDKDKEPTDEPEDENNHLWDATRYAYTMHVKRRNAIVAAPQDHSNTWERWTDEDRNAPVEQEDVDEFYDE